MQQNALITAGLLKQAQIGDTFAIKLWTEITKEDEIDARDNTVFELPARVLASSFVDLNRFITEKSYLEYVLEAEGAPPNLLSFL